MSTSAKQCILNEIATTKVSLFIAKRLSISVEEGDYT